MLNFLLKDFVHGKRYNSIQVVTVPISTASELFPLMQLCISCTRYTISQHRAFEGFIVKRALVLL